RAWLDNSPLLVYTGTFGKINGVGYMVELAKELKKLNSSIKILLVGDGAEKDRVIAKAKSIGVLEDNLFYESQIPKKDIPALLSAATIASALFIDLPEMRPNSANKFFDALASGTPIFLNYGGWMHELVNKHGCGITAWQMNIKEAAKQLDEKLQDSDWLNKASISARQLAEQEFDRDKLAQQLMTVLELVSEGKFQQVESVAPGKY
ncbi:glycosyltransferase, partial [Psychrobacter namhaensis]